MRKKIEEVSDEEWAKWCRYGCWSKSDYITTRILRIGFPILWIIGIVGCPIVAYLRFLSDLGMLG